MCLGICVVDIGGVVSFVYGRVMFINNYGGVDEVLLLFMCI